MRSAAVLTFHWAHNYGAALQTYAMQEALTRYFGRVEIIDYAPERYAAIYRGFGLKQPKMIVRDLLRLPAWKSRRLREDRFNGFISSSLRLSGQKYTERGRLAYDQADCLFCGSDQIWNPDLTGGFDPVYFARVETKEGCRKIAYAASAGRNIFSFEEDRELASLLANFDVLSVREQSLQQHVKYLTAQPVHTVLDPTLLLSAQQWRKVGVLPPEAAKAVKRKYLLLYSVAGYAKTRRIARQIAQERGLRLIELANDGKSPKRLYLHPTVSAAGPAEFVALFDHAEFIVTDSFHGTAFALVFGKDFYCVPHRSRGSRMVDLLRSVGLAERLVYGESVPANAPAIDHSAVEQRLDELRDYSLAYIMQAAEGGEIVLPEVSRTPLNRLPGEKSDCCGCGACADVCAAGAIAMTADEQGFRYPVIDELLCLDCGRCNAVCAFNSGAKTEPDLEQQAYACKHKSASIRRASTSGGLFSAITDPILAAGGVVYGAAYDQNLRVAHRRAATGAERDLMRGAKYTQSDLAAVYQQLRKDLRTGRQALFSGTPCQTAAVEARLLAEYDGASLRERLFLVDVVCYGVPSPLLFAEFVDYCGKQQDSKVTDHQFRTKDRGWRKTTAAVSFASGSRDFRSPLSQSFNRLLFSNAFLRPSCYECRYCRTARPSDLTMADFWGVEKSHPKFADNKGVSLALVNTAQGRRLWEGAAPHLESEPAAVGQARQPRLYCPTQSFGDSEEMWRFYHEQGFAALIERYARQVRRARWAAPAKKLLQLLHVR